MTEEQAKQAHDRLENFRCLRQIVRNAEDTLSRMSGEDSTSVELISISDFMMSSYLSRDHKKLIEKAMRPVIEKIADDTRKQMDELTIN